MKGNHKEVGFYGKGWIQPGIMITAMIFRVPAKIENLVERSSVSAERLCSVQFVIKTVCIFY
jgi:hypothetical protein